MDVICDSFVDNPAYRMSKAAVHGEAIVSHRGQMLFVRSAYQPFFNKS